MKTYRTFAEETAPNWGAEYWQRLNSVLGLFFDTFAEGVTQAVRARFYSEGPADAMDYAAQERGLERGPAETLAQFRRRLREAFEAYRYAGTATAIQDQLAAVGFSNVFVYEAATWYPASPDWARFWVVIDLPHDYPQPRSAWDTAVWDVFVWDGVPESAVDLIRRIVNKWKPAHARFAGGFIVHEGSTWDHSLGPGDASYDGKVTAF